MRIIGGSRKGLLLKGPRSEKIRPALDKVKQAVFNILGNIDGCRVLDLFAGTGSMGIEALSRGAREAVFVDEFREAIGLIHANLASSRLETQAHVFTMRLPTDLRRLAKRSDPFDLIFVDPPYDRGLVVPSLNTIVQEGLLVREGFIIVEHSPREQISGECQIKVIDERSYGQTRISFLQI